MGGEGENRVEGGGEFKGCWVRVKGGHDDVGEGGGRGGREGAGGEGTGRWGGEGKGGGGRKEG